jgi:cytochrome d ubiquinol oxidase subunit I
VDEKAEVTHGIAIPGGLGFLTHGDFSQSVTGLKHFPKAERPPVQVTFQMYHLMVAIGMALIGLSVLGNLMRWKGTLYTCKPFLLLLVGSVLLPQIANQVGWGTAEVGRQPWIVYGLMKTAQGISPVVKSNQILASIFMFSTVYLLLFILFIYLLDRKIKKGPIFVDTDAIHDDPRLTIQGREEDSNAL